MPTDAPTHYDIALELTPCTGKAAPPDTYELNLSDRMISGDATRMWRGAWPT